MPARPIVDLLREVAQHVAVENVAHVCCVPASGTWRPDATAQPARLTVPDVRVTISQNNAMTEDRRRTAEGSEPGRWEPVRSRRRCITS